MNKFDYTAFLEHEVTLTLVDGNKLTGIICKNYPNCFKFITKENKSYILSDHMIVDIKEK